MLNLNEYPAVGSLHHQHYRTIQSRQYTLIDRGCHIHSIMMTRRRKVLHHHSTSRTEKQQVRQCMLIRSRHCCRPFPFFVLPAKIIFLLGTVHQFLRTDGSQRVNRLHRIHIHLPAENILNIHDIAVLAFQCLNQRIGFQCIGHHLRTHLTVHISRQVVP